MKLTQLLTPALALAMGVAAVPAVAQAAFHGPATFPCNGAHDDWRFDGLYGWTTEQAVRNFQKANGLMVDGIAGPRTLRALGLSGRTLHCGLGGNDVLALQRALSAKGYWHGAAAKPAAKPSPKPTRKPTPRPTPMATPTPMPSETPYVEPTPMPTATPTPYVEPTPSPEASPMPISEEAPWRPTLELRGGAWFFNPSGYFYASGLPANNVWSPLTPSWDADANLWFGGWGIGGGATWFNSGLMANTGTVAASPLAGTTMYDAQLKFRDAYNVWNLGLGYRGFAGGTAALPAGLQFGTVGLGMELPLGVDWLLLDAKVLGGYAMNQSYLVDGNVGLGLRFRPFTLEAGVRHLTLQPAGGATINQNGPVANLKLAF